MDARLMLEASSSLFFLDNMYSELETSFGTNYFERKLNS